MASSTNAAVMILVVLLIGFPLSRAEIIRHMGNPGATRQGADRSVEDSRGRRSRLVDERDGRAPSVDLGVALG